MEGAPLGLARRALGHAFAGGYYAPPVTVRLSDGALAHYAGTWKDGTKDGTKKE